MLAEFNIGKNLRHPNIIDYRYFVHEYQKEREQYHFHTLIEMVEGGDMDAYLRRPNRSDVIQPAKEIGAQILSGLAYLHNNRIVHRDLKPENIMFDAEQKNIKLIDLGVSTEYNEKEAENAGMAGTYRYMSPEQFDGKLSLKTDIWSFGCVLL